MCVYIYILIYYLFYSFISFTIAKNNLLYLCVCVCVYNTFVFDDDNLNDEKRRQPINQNKKLK